MARVFKLWSQSITHRINRSTRITSKSTALSPSIEGYDIASTTTCSSHRRPRRTFARTSFSEQYLWQQQSRQSETARRASRSHRGCIRASGAFFAGSELGGRSLTGSVLTQDLRRLSLVNRTFSRLARPAIWRRLDIDTGVQRLGDLRLLIEDSFYDGISLFVDSLYITVLPIAPSATLGDQAACITAIAALIVRLPVLTTVHLDVADGAPEQASTILYSMAFTNSTFKTLSIEWNPTMDGDMRNALFPVINRHAGKLRTLSLHTNDAVQLLPGDINAMDRIEHLALSGFDINYESFNPTLPLSPLRAISLDLDSSVDFFSLVTIFLPTLPCIQLLAFYLVFPPLTSTLSLPPLPTLDTLRTLEIRSVTAEELDGCLTYLSENPYLTRLVISAETIELPLVGEVLAMIFERRPGDIVEESVRGVQTVVKGRPFDGLSVIELEWEGSAMPTITTGAPVESVEMTAEDRATLSATGEALIARMESRQIVVTTGMLE